MSYVLVFGVAMVGFVELNTYDTAESCKAAAIASLKEKSSYEGNKYRATGNYRCILKPA